MIASFLNLFFDNRVVYQSIGERKTALKLLLRKTGCTVEEPSCGNVFGVYGSNFLNVLRQIEVSESFVFKQIETLQKAGRSTRRALASYSEAKERLTIASTVPTKSVEHITDGSRVSGLAALCGPEMCLAENIRSFWLNVHREMKTPDELFAELQSLRQLGDVFLVKEQSILDQLVFFRRLLVITPESYIALSGTIDFKTHE
jgi:hypothetical protein